MRGNTREKWPCFKKQKVQYLNRKAKSTEPIFWHRALSVLNAPFDSITARGALSAALQSLSLSGIFSPIASASVCYDCEILYPSSCTALWTLRFSLMGVVNCEKHGKTFVPLQVVCCGFWRIIVLLERIFSLKLSCKVWQPSQQRWLNSFFHWPSFNSLQKRLLHSNEWFGYLTSCY